MHYLDSGVLISALYIRDDKHAACLALLESGEALTSTHALAESFSALTGQYRVRNDVAAESLLSAADTMDVEPLILVDYQTTLRSARARGIQGGLIYDALHAAVARRLRVERLYTLNVSNFEHVASDLSIAAP